MLLFVAYDTNDKAAPLMHMSQHAATEHLRGRNRTKNCGRLTTDYGRLTTDYGLAPLLAYYERVSLYLRIRFPAGVRAYPEAFPRTLS